MPFPFPPLRTSSWGQAGEATRYYVSASRLLQTSDSWQAQLRPGIPDASIKLEEVSDFFVPVIVLVTLQPYDIIVTSSKHSNFAVVRGKWATVLIRGWCTAGPAAPLAPVHRMRSDRGEAVPGLIPLTVITSASSQQPSQNLLNFCLANNCKR